MMKNSLKEILHSATQLDVFDANCAFSQRLGGFDILLDSGNSPRCKGLLFRIIIFFIKWVWAGVKSGRRGVKQSWKYGILAAYCTNNQYLSMKPVVEHLDDAAFIQIGSDPSLSFSSFRCRTISLFFFFYALRDFFRADPYQKRAMQYCFEQYWNAYGYYTLCRLYLRRNKPFAVMVSNDHVLVVRTLVLAAHDAGIPTVFMQHAAISKTLPPLIFDYAFLEGRNSLAQCLENGKTDTEIYISGIPKMDCSLKKMRNRSGVHVMGVAVSVFDDLCVAKELCEDLCARYPEARVVFRPHPALINKIQEFSGFFEKSEIELSDPLSEPVHDYLSRLDVLIAGESNIHLEATLFNTLSIYFSMGGVRRDHYGFLKNEMIDGCETIGQVMDQIDEAFTAYPSVRSLAKGYCGTVGAEYDGHSAELVAHTIRSVLGMCDSMDLNKIWKVSMECDHAYELRDGVVQST